MKLHPPVLNRKLRATRAGLLCTAVLAATAFTAHAQNTGFGTVTPASKVTVKGNFAVGTGNYTTIAAPAFGAIVQGFTGIGIVTPTNQLHVFAAADPVRFEGVQPSVQATDVPLVIQTDGVVKKGKPVLSREFIQISAPNPNNNNVGQVLSGAAGENIKFGPAVEVQSANSSSVFTNITATTITLAPGRTYKLSFDSNNLNQATDLYLQYYNVTDGVYFGPMANSQFASAGGGGTSITSLTTLFTPTKLTTIALKDALGSVSTRLGVRQDDTGGRAPIDARPTLIVETVD